jgi:capsular exopolysaccharide synthesis family protein
MIRNRRGTFIRVFLVIMTIGVAATLLSKPIYQTRVQFLIPVVSPSLQLVEASNPVAAILSATQPDSVSTQVRELQSEPFVNQAKQEVGIVPDSPADPSVRTEAVKDTNVIQVTVDGPDRDKIVRLANKIIELHVGRTDEVRQNDLGSTIGYARKELDKANAQLQEATMRLLAFRKTSRMSQVHAQQDAWAKQVSDLEGRMLQAQSDRDSTRAQVRRLEAQIAALPIDSDRVHDRPNPLRAQLQTKIDALEVQRLELLQDFSPTSKRVTALDEQIATFNAQLARTPETVRSREFFPNPRRDALEEKLRQRQAELVQHEEDYRATQAQFGDQARRMQDLGPWEVRFAALTQERDRAQARVTSLTDRLQDLEFRKNVHTNNIRVIEAPARPKDPIRPKPLENFALTFIVGLLLAAGMVFLQEYLDDRVNEPADVERGTGLPSLGHVPALAQPQGQLAVLEAHTHAAEAYRALRSSVMFAALDAPVHRLQVTSPSKGEGKTTTAVNLATAMALDGKRVIIIDADLRRPSLHKVMGISASPGLSELLIANTTLDEVLHTTQIPGLSVLPAGTIPPNPAELLGRPAFEELLAELDARADVLIVDSAPCLPVTDPLIVAARMNGVMLVVFAGQTKKTAVKQALAMLDRARARVIGVVFNRVDTDRSTFYRQYYTDGYYAELGTAHGRNGKNGHNGKPVQNGSIGHIEQFKSLQLNGGHPVAAGEGSGCEETPR